MALSTFSFLFFCARLPAHFNISGYDSAPEYHSIIRTQPKWLINECEDALQREHLTRDFCSQRDLMLQLSFELWLHLVSWILTRNFYGLKLFPRNSRATCWRQNSPTQTALLLPIASRCSPEPWPAVWQRGLRCGNGACCRSVFYVFFSALAAQVEFSTFIFQCHWLLNLNYR